MEVGLDGEGSFVACLGLVEFFGDRLRLRRGGDGGAGGSAFFERGIASAVHGFARGAHVHVAPIKDGRRGAGLELLDGSISNFLCFFVRQARTTCEIVGQVRTLRDAKNEKIVSREFVVAPSWSRLKPSTPSKEAHDRSERHLQKH